MLIASVEAPGGGSHTGDQEGSVMSRNNIGSSQQVNRVPQSIVESSEVVWIKVSQGEADPWEDDGDRALFAEHDPDCFNPDPTQRALRKRRLHAWGWLHDGEANYIFARQNDAVYLGVLIDTSPRDRERWRQRLSDALGGIPEKPCSSEPMFEVVCGWDSEEDALQLEHLTPLKQWDLAYPDSFEWIHTAYTGETIPIDELVSRAKGYLNGSKPEWLAVMLSDCGYTKSEAISDLEKNGSFVALDAIICIHQGWGRIQRGHVSVPKFRSFQYATLLKWNQETLGKLFSHDDHLIYKMGVDLLFDGHYPPTWTSEDGPLEYRTPEAREYWQRRLKIAELEARNEGVGEGHRNEKAAEVAGRLIGQMVDPWDQNEIGDVKESFRQWNQRNTPPLGKIELFKTFDSILGRERSKREKQQREEKRVPQSLPEVPVHGGATSLTSTAAMLGRLLAETDRYYFRGGAIVRVKCRGDAISLEPLKPANLPSVFEEVARLVTVKHDNGNKKVSPATYSESGAKLVASSEVFIDALPPIEVVSPCPILIERNSELVQVVGYDRESGILAKGQALPDMPLQEAIQELRKLLQDFHFATPSDRSRALAAIITPALVHGGLLNGRAPLDLGEADKSQAGKGFRNKLTAAVYRQTVEIVTQQQGGVGSLEETFNAKLVKGSNFIALDNIRGKVNSPALEAFLTGDTYSARVPYSNAVAVDPSRYFLMMTTNQAELTEDMANRASCVRIIKRGEDHVFTKFPEGEILDHVRANQPRFLAAVFAVIREWHRRGKQRTDERRHDFRVWAQTLDWVVKNILGEAPLLDGHGEIKAQATNPAMDWIRRLAVAIEGSDLQDNWIRSGQMVSIAADCGFAELKDQGTTQAAQLIGTKLCQCFRGCAGDELRIGKYQVWRRKVEDERGRPKTEYQFGVM